MEKKRQIGADFLRGIAITLMVYGHHTHVGSSAPLQQEVVRVIYSFHMPLFLIISGFFFTPFENPKRSLKRTAKTIALPYVIFLTLFLMGRLVAPKLGIPVTHGSPPPSMTELARIVFLHPHGPYWFLHALVVIQLVMGASFAVANKFSVGRIEAFIFSIGILYALSFSPFITLGERSVFYFSIGVLLRCYTSSLPTAVGTGFTLILVYSFVESHASFKQTLPTESVWVMSILLFLNGVAERYSGNPIVQILSWIGRNTLIILVLHAFFVTALRPQSSHVLLVDSTGIFHSLLSTTLTIALCLFCSRMFDHLRLSRFLFGVDRVYSPFTSNPSLQQSPQGYT
ncbi:MAG: acyltransferase family protein [Gammaproteobacteria bacterium]